MKRTILALAVASISCVAMAGPPPTAGPVNVNVVNPLPLPTTEVPSLTNLEQLYFTGIGGIAAGPTTGYVNLQQDVILHSYDAWVQAAAGTGTDKCDLAADIVDSDLNFVAALGPVAALHGHDGSLSVRLPNVFVDASRELKVKMTVSSPTLCVFGFQLRGVKVQ
jgi:hypothetical protein